ncbi:MAG: transglutaminase-like domain-containing protein [Spirochaetaceae bacterium]|nr:transglutaminase-like domain-containing protein [Spirochaetaceae bacterium]
MPNMRYYKNGINTAGILLSGAFFARTAACYALLFQARFFAGELAHSAFFAVFLFQGIVIPFILKKLPVRTPAALVITAAVPFVIRFFIAGLRIVAHIQYIYNNDINVFIPFDSLLLLYDNNIYAVLIPFYYISITTYIARMPHHSQRAAAVTDIIVLCIVFVIFSSATLTVYKWPALKLIVFCAILFLETLAIIFTVLAAGSSLPSESALSFVLPLILAAAAGFLLFKPLNEQELEKGGGLLQSKLFSFDFAPFLSLENEITMNDDLVFIVRKNDTQNENEFELPEVLGESDLYNGQVNGGIENSNNDMQNNIPFEDIFFPQDAAYLMRRFVLSAYNSKSGFTRDDVIDETAHRRILPAGKTEFAGGGTTAPLKRVPLEQEYYLVNIDSEAFIAMNEPVSAAPFEDWNASSFKAAYKTQSMISGASARDLSNAVSNVLQNDTLGLTAGEFAWYTAYGDDKNRLTSTEERIKTLSNNLIQENSTYWGKIQLLYNYLKYGDYLYSLKPGAAPDGDQLAYFLFTTKRGYCSYFAFAFASMLRSIGVPCRVAVGFFLDYESGRLGFYPVMANMAHAWVEVWFPGFGWIEYDPTTEKLAPDEEWRFSAGPPSELLERLLKEILDNHSNLREKKAAPPAARMQSRSRRTAAKIFLTVFIALIPILAALALLYRRFKWYIKYIFTQNIRRQCVYLYQYCIYLQKHAGGKAAGTAVSDEINRVYEQAQKAKFAGAYTENDHLLTLDMYKKFKASLRKH